LSWPSASNSFFVEIVAALCDELDQLGVANSVHTGAHGLTLIDGDHRI
jgi:hypothetical protein